MVIREVKLKKLTTQIDSKTIQINLLNTDSLSKIKLQLLYYKEHGIKNFIVDYDSKDINLPISKVISKMNLISIFKYLKEYDLILSFSGFSNCIFNSLILKPELKWYFEENVKFIQKEISNCEKTLCCKLCSYNSNCQGIDINYVKSFGFDEFKPLSSNKISYDLMLTQIDSWKNEELISIGKMILKDYIKDNFCLRKKFIFVKSFPEKRNEIQSGRFSYFINNRNDDFEETFLFLENFCKKDFLSSIKIYLAKSNQINLGFGTNKDNEVIKTLYFKINDLSNNERDELSNLLDLKFENNILMVGINIVSGVYTYKLYNDYENINTVKIKDYVQDIEFETKRILFKYLNSLTKPLKDVLFDEVYKDGKLQSKKIFISMEKNLYNLSSLSILFGFRLNSFQDKKLIYLCFELENGKETKVTFFYSYAPPKFICLH